MDFDKAISRRSFLKTSMLVGGGMLIGFNLFTACKETAKPPVDISKLNFKDFNAYIKIADNGMVTIFSPNPEIGQGVKTSMPMLIAEELDVPWEHVHVVQGNLDTQNFTAQIAGGSQSIRDNWMPLRETGATARQMLIIAAAAKWGIDPSQCVTKEGVVINHKGEKLHYGELVDDAAQLEVPEQFELKKPENFKIIGQNKGNVDIDEIVSGQPLFGLDYKVEGMKYACVLRPPGFGQTLESFDDSAALKINGVQKVLQFGDKIAVIADHTWAAMKGQKAVKAQWSSNNELEDSEKHEKILSDLLNGNTFETKRKDGDVEKAFAEADRIIERSYKTPFIPHNCMEPMNFFAHVTAEQIKLVGPVQTPESTAQAVADLLKRDMKEVSLEMTRQGGGFGRRLYGDFALEAAEISHLSQLPIKVVFTREDDMTAGTYRPPMQYKIKAAIKDNQITAYHLKEAGLNQSMYYLIPDFFPAGAIENFQIDVAKAESNITTGAWRAPVTNFHAYAEQCFMDELAEALKVDRTELQLNLLKKVEANKDERITYSPKRMAKVIELVKEKAQWGKNTAGVYQGFSSYYCHSSHVAEIAEIELKDNMPVIKRIVCAIDCGVVVNPIGAVNQCQGGVIDGIGTAMYGGLEFENGRATSDNFNSYRMIRMSETPDVEIHFVNSQEAPTGLGEPPLPPAAPAVANAIYKALNKRLTQFPLIKELKG